MKKTLCVIIALLMLMTGACAKKEPKQSLNSTSIPMSGSPLSLIMEEIYKTAEGKIENGEALCLHYYHDNSYDGDIHVSQEIFTTAWKMLSGIEVSDPVSDPGICDANYFCSFTFEDGSEIGFSFIADEYFCFNGKTYRVTDSTKAKACRRYLENMMEQYSEDAFSNVEIGRGMTELDKIDSTVAPVTLFDVDLDGDGNAETLEFKFQSGGDEFTDGLVCTCLKGNNSVDIGIFSAEKRRVRLFIAELPTGKRIAAVVNYVSPVCGNMTSFVYMANGQVYRKDYADIGPAEFDKDESIFYMTDSSTITADSLMAE